MARSTRWWRRPGWRVGRSARVTEPARTGGTGRDRPGPRGRGQECARMVLPPPVPLATAAERLATAGVAAPRREALRIWRELNTRPESDFQAAVERRAGGEPLAYVTGQAGFRHLLLRADRRALIPRPETEQLVELVLQAAP